MVTDFDGTGLEFEAPARLDVRTSKAFETPDGDTIRVIIGADDTAVMVGIGKTEGTVVVTGVKGDTTVARGFWGRLWDKVKGAASTLYGIVAGSDEKECKTVTHVTIVDGQVTGITTTTTCS